MKIAPLSHQFGRRLEEIDNQIDTCLRVIRQNLAELDQATRKGDGAGAPPAGDSFSEVLGKAVSDSRARGAPADTDSG